MDPSISPKTNRASPTNLSLYSEVEQKLITEDLGRFKILIILIRYPGHRAARNQSGEFLNKSFSQPTFPWLLRARLKKHFNGANPRRLNSPSPGFYLICPCPNSESLSFLSTPHARVACKPCNKWRQLRFVHIALYNEFLAWAANYIYCTHGAGRVVRGE